MPTHDVFLKMETVDGERSSGGIQWLMGDGSVRLAGTQQTDSGYGNPSSFQIISQGAEESSRLFVGNLTYDSHDSATGFDCSELTQWASNTPTAPQPDSSAVATIITIEFDSALYPSDGFFLT